MSKPVTDPLLARSMAENGFEPTHAALADYRNFLDCRATAMLLPELQTYLRTIEILGLANLAGDPGQFFSRLRQHFLEVQRLLLALSSSGVT